MASIEIPDFAVLLGPFIQKIPDASRPAFLAALERGAAQRYREWAEASPDQDPEPSSKGNQTRRPVGREGNPPAPTSMVTKALSQREGLPPSDTRTSKWKGELATITAALSATVISPVTASTWKTPCPLPPVTA